MELSRWSKDHYLWKCRMSHEEKESFLTDDPEISSQRWCLLSFISPENVLNRKDPFFFAAFLRQYELQVRTKAVEEFLVKTITKFNAQLEDESNKLSAADLSGAAVLCRKSMLQIEPFVTEFQKFSKEKQKELSISKLQEEYDDFMFKNQVQLEDDFYAKNDFRTTVRGLKIRGAYSTREEAESRAKKLQKMDADHNIFVGQIGKWLPWDPAPSAIPDQEYAEDQLNTLMKKYKENEEAREVFHKEQRDRAKKTAKGVVSMPAAEQGGNYNSSKNLTVSKAEDAEASVPSLGSGASEFAGMFSGPADLAIQRKMERK
jgi:hypothetical protein